MASLDNEETRLCESIDKICRDLASKEGLIVTKDAVSVIQDSLLSYLKTFAQDMEAFATHAKRDTVTVVDVVYCSTKSVELNESLLRFVEGMQRNYLVCFNNQIKELDYTVDDTAAINSL